MSISHLTIQLLLHTHPPGRSADLMVTSKEFQILLMVTTTSLVQISHHKANTCIYTILLRCCEPGGDYNETCFVIYQLFNVWENGDKNVMPPDMLMEDGAH